jgi:Profilin
MKKSLILFPALFLALFLGKNAAAQSGWDTHLAKLKDKQKFTFSAIYGVDGTQWTSTAFGQPTKLETDYLFSGFVNPNALFANGPTLSGIKYMATKVESNLIIGKKGSLGFVAFKSDKAIILGIFNESNISLATANLNILAFGSYMKSIGF